MDYKIFPGDLDVNNLEYREPKKNDSGAGRSVYISHNKKPIVIQTPVMYTNPYGLSKWENKDPVTNKVTSVKWSLDLSFKGYQERKFLKEFYDKMDQLDQKLIEDGHQNSAQWIGSKSKVIDVTEAAYTRNIKWSKDKVTKEINKQYPPNFKLNLKLDKNDNFAFPVYDNHRELIELNAENTKSSKVTAIIQCLGLWLSGNKYGVSWKVLQLKVEANPNIKGYAFGDVEGDEIGDIVSDNDEKKPEEADDDDEKGHKVEEDSDSEIESSEDELERPPSPPQTQKKKAVTKKK